MSVTQYLSRLIRNRMVRHLYQSAILAMFTTSVVYAQAATGGLTRTRTVMQMLLDNLNIILPIACVIIGVIIWVLYSAEIMRKDDAVRWGIGVIGAGSVAELVVLFWK